MCSNPFHSLFYDFPCQLSGTDERRSFRLPGLPGQTFHEFRVPKNADRLFLATYNPRSSSFFLYFKVVKNSAGLLPRMDEMKSAAAAPAAYVWVSRRWGEKGSSSIHPNSIKKQAASSCRLFFTCYFYSIFVPKERKREGKIVCQSST